MRLRGQRVSYDITHPERTGKFTGLSFDGDEEEEEEGLAPPWMG